jgi:hypothetical protein
MSIGEFAEKLAGECNEKTFQIELDGEAVDVIAVDDMKDLIFDVARSVEGGCE